MCATFAHAEILDVLVVEAFDAALRLRCAYRWSCAAVPLLSPGPSDKCT